MDDSCTAFVVDFDVAVLCSLLDFTVKGLILVLNSNKIAICKALCNGWHKRP